MKRLGIIGFALVLFATGCMKSDPKPQESAKSEAKSEHEGWWCVEHGIPEAECIKCNAKMKEACKAKGGWCDKHDIAKEQCFKCDPSLKEKYAAVYRAKFGSEPPEPEEN